MRNARRKKAIFSRHSPASCLSGIDIVDQAIVPPSEVNGKY